MLSFELPKAQADQHRWESLLPLQLTLELDLDQHRNWTGSCHSLLQVVSQRWAALATVQQKKQDLALRFLARPAVDQAVPQLLLEVLLEVAAVLRFSAQPPFAGLHLRSSARFQLRRQ